MGYLPPPDAAGPNRSSYADAYRDILRAHRRSPLTSASSVILLVSPDVDALCAARMFADLLKTDDVNHRIIPVSGLTELERLCAEMVSYTELHTLILLNMGSLLDIQSPQFFGDFDTQIKIHIIDSARPYNLDSLFSAVEGFDRVFVWDDGSVDKIDEDRKAWETLQYAPEPDSDDDSDDDSEEELSQDEDTDNDYEEGSRPGKRRSIGDGSRKGKRRKVDDDVGVPKLSRDEWMAHSTRVRRYYRVGTWHATSAAGIVYMLATALERADNEFLWLAIKALTFQYTAARVSREDYERYHTVYYDEVFRLNPPRPQQDTNPGSLNPDDFSIRTTDELRFTLVRHWNLYDAMFHSSYVASKLGIWKERGRKKLAGLLAKIGFSLPQTQQAYAHMDMDLKQMLVKKLTDISSEYAMTELSYPSFMRCYGYRSQPLSAADAVEGISALLDVATGVKIEVEIEGARNGGEWFGGGRVWEAGSRDSRRFKENVPPGSSGALNAPKVKPAGEVALDTDEIGKADVDWWVRNFWLAYDALRDIGPLRQALSLSMSLHRAIIRQGTSIIDKQDVRTMRNHRVVVLSQGPDLALFSHPGVLARLALWLVDTLRDRLPGTITSARTKKKSLPFVLACLDEINSQYVIVGVTGALEFGDVRKNEFGLQFLEAKDRCNARTRYGKFDLSVIEIEQEDLSSFLGALCEEPDH